MAEALGIDKVRVSFTVAALLALLLGAGALALEWGEQRRVRADVADLKQWKARVVEEGWLPPALANRLTVIEEVQRETLSELRALRGQLAGYRVADHRPVYRAPESSRGGQ